MILIKLDLYLHNYAIYDSFSKANFEICCIDIQAILTNSSNFGISVKYLNCVDRIERKFVQYVLKNIKSLTISFSFSNSIFFRILKDSSSMLVKLFINWLIEFEKFFNAIFSRVLQPSFTLESWWIGFRAW